MRYYEIAEQQDRARPKRLDQSGNGETFLRKILAQNLSNDQSTDSFMI